MGDSLNHIGRLATSETITFKKHLDGTSQNNNVACLMRPVY